MESQFHLANIKKDETKFHHILAALPEEIASTIPLDGASDYEALKKAVLDSLKANHHQLIEEALSAVESGDKRPTQLVVEIKRRFADFDITPDEAIIKSRILSALPPNIKAALVGHDSAALDDYVKIADSMLAVASPAVNPYSLSAVESGFRRNQPAETRRFNSYNHQQFNRYSNLQTGNNCSNIRQLFRDQRPKLCHAHILYAEKARTCRRWCRWPNKPKTELRDNEKTPAQSRTSSI